MSVSVPAIRRMVGVALVSTLAGLPGRGEAQAPSEHIALGDRAQRAMNAGAALRHFEDALAVDPASYEALCKAARAAVESGEFMSDTKERDRLYGVAERYARKAVELDAAGADGHFELSRALGRKALSVSKRDQVRYAADVRTHALLALKANPQHSGALHVMGMWNYNVMRLNGFVRFLARRFLGGQVFDTASWQSAEKSMEAAAGT